ncbi:flagellar basal body L-ring protein FlgH [Candidatus Uabimicrobium amorphum]|uniref:Flagellar L-ring protein n=1 Tax=Uabimicrobium amorphum TaxID=2596890 RepID=A0A5S9IQT5_UABAM|nr:flagellar basal body L-ring protein FlgH [Candidatus Uabimicrobium amorphum]BBM84985.1 flagellar L-ring protein [Candidatus Uabimicrobium amorphum]
MNRWLCLFYVVILGCSSSKTVAPKEIPTYSPQQLSLQPLAPEKPPQHGSLFDENFTSFYNNRKYKKGDILTVLINERNDVQQDNEVELLKNSQSQLDVDPGAGDLLQQVGGSLVTGISSLDASRNKTHIGEATYQQTSSFDDRIAVVVTEIREDGLLVVWGKRNIRLDGEAKTLVVSGMVQPQSISDDKVISSSQLAMANIHLEGKGTLTSTTEPGTGSKVFGKILDIIWPF